MWKWVLNILALLVLAGGVVYRMNYSERDQVNDASAMGIQGGDFTLKSGEGEVSLSDYRGKTVIVYFGFASCPDVCPMSLSYLNGALQKIDNPEDVQVVFISVDYKRDTPEKVSEYAEYFGQNFVGVTGTKEQIEKVAKDYGVYFKFIDLKDSEMGYTVDHTSRFFIINSRGELEKAVSSEEKPEVFLKELRSVMGDGK